MPDFSAWLDTLKVLTFAGINFRDFANFLGVRERLYLNFSFVTSSFNGRTAESKAPKKPTLHLRKIIPAKFLNWPNRESLCSSRMLILAFGDRKSLIPAKLNARESYQ